MHAATIRFGSDLSAVTLGRHAPCPRVEKQGTAPRRGSRLAAGRLQTASASATASFGCHSAQARGDRDPSQVLGRIEEQTGARRVDGGQGSAVARAVSERSATWTIAKPSQPSGLVQSAFKGLQRDPAGVRLSADVAQTSTGRIVARCRSSPPPPPPSISHTNIHTLACLAWRLSIFECDVKALLPLDRALSPSQVLKQVWKLRSRLRGAFAASSASPPLTPP